MLVRAILPVFSIKHGVNDHSLGAKNISCGCHGCSRDFPVQYYHSDPRVHRSGRRFRLVVATGEIRAGVHPLLTSQMPRRLLHGRSVHVHAWSVILQHFHIRYFRFAVSDSQRDVAWRERLRVQREEKERRVLQKQAFLRDEVQCNGASPTTKLSLSRRQWYYVRVPQ